MNQELADQNYGGKRIRKLFSTKQKRLIILKRELHHAPFQCTTLQSTPLYSFEQFTTDFNLKKENSTQNCR